MLALDIAAVVAQVAGHIFQEEVAGLLVHILADM
jgi:hypothetical protein